MIKSENIEVIPYEEKYHMGVVECLKRNFPKLNNMSTRELSNWLGCIVKCNWYRDEEPSKHGYVVLCNGRVVGYCGVILSCLEYGSKNYKYANLTTWGVDAPYGFFVFEVLTDILKRMDVVSDFTPNQVVERINKLFSFDYITRDAYKFVYDETVTTKSCDVKTTKMSEISYWKDLTVKGYYDDHRKYGCEGLFFEANDDKDDLYFIFYSPIEHDEWINVVYVSNADRFSQYLKLIIQEVYTEYGKGIICDGCFLNIELVDSTIKYERVNRNRMIYTKDKSVVIPGLLYSELPVFRY